MHQLNQKCFPENVLYSNTGTERRGEKLLEGEKINKKLHAS